MTDIDQRVGSDIEGLGGVLRCSMCGYITPLLRGEAGRNLESGWPKCCGYTMTWITQRQIDAGEMPEVDA